MDLVVIVAITVLMIVFLGSTIALIFICRHRRAQDNSDQKPILKYWKDQTCDDASRSSSVTDLELEDVFQLSPNIEKILKDNTGNWIGDNSGLIEHCEGILRCCHVICDRLIALALNPNYRLDQEMMDNVRLATKRVMPRANDLVHSMYWIGNRKEVQAALLEARAAALVMAVSNVAILFRSACKRQQQQSHQHQQNPTGAGTATVHGSNFCTVSSGFGQASTSSGITNNTGSSTGGIGTTAHDWINPDLADLEARLARLRETVVEANEERVEFLPPAPTMISENTATAASATSAAALASKDNEEV